MKSLLSLYQLYTGLCVSLVCVYSHPMCLDFRPPFWVGRTLDLCPEYSTFGCCTELQDAALKVQYTDLVMQAKSKGIVASCDNYIRDLLCQRCSPYAAHLYEAEGYAGTLGRKWPGLCRPYCNELHSKCRDIMPLIYPDYNNVKEQLISEDAFCEEMKLVDQDYCYPDLLNLDNLVSEIRQNEISEDGCICFEEYLGNLRNPIIFESANDGTGRMFVAEQIGIVHVLTPERNVLPTPFLDIQHKVLTSKSKGEERGFLGLVFHPEHKTNRKMYVYYSVRVGSQDRTRVSEFQVFENDINRVDQSSERVVIEVKQPYWNHNGGEMLFDDSGLLYVFVGDGGSAGDPQGYSQNKSVLLGKVLRIDINTNDSSVPYRIPQDNPFVDEVGARGEIYAYGIRNIWRCSVDRGDRVTGAGRGRIFCGDVGQSAWEEIDIIQKGGNYGWNAREGNACYKTNLCDKIGEEVFPIHVYGHSTGKSVIGGYMYRGCQNPGLHGSYIYGDFFSGRLFRLKYTNNQWQNKDLVTCADDYCFGHLTNKYEKNILSFGEDENGEIYMLTTDYASTRAANGKIYKIVDPHRTTNPEVCKGNKPPVTRPITQKPSTTGNSASGGNRHWPTTYLHVVLIILIMVAYGSC